ncbi:hypothetical protein [Mesorhizobium sp. M0060]|uniref:hypothetical protein n=1 Tax=Mesorhizobium sp. M0060 TaxID=2956866 RepID=UPI00333CA92E
MNDSGEAAEEPQPITPQPPRAIEKTPMYTAMNAARYQRQTLIRDIERDQPKLICYVAGNKAAVDRIDTAWLRRHASQHQSGRSHRSPAAYARRRH